MSFFYATMCIELLLILGTLGLLFSMGYSTRLKYILILLMLMLGLSFWINPDLKNWYLNVRYQQRFAEAEAILHDAKKFSKLMNSLKSRVQHEPQDAQAWYLLGRLYADQGQWNQAHDALFQAYRLQPQQIKIAVVYVESVLQSQGHLTAFSNKILRDVLKKDSQQPDALMMLAVDAKQRQCYREAIHYWQRLLVSLPVDSELFAAVKQEIIAAKKQKHKKCQHPPN